MYSKYVPDMSIFQAKQIYLLQEGIVDFCVGWNDDDKQLKLYKDVNSPIWLEHASSKTTVYYLGVKLCICG